eukprot:scaffold265131_cov32-Tisochrysis_lutea.AAC.1
MDHMMNASIDKTHHKEADQVGRHLCARTIVALNKSSNASSNTSKATFGGMRHAARILRWHDAWRIAEPAPPLPPRAQ